MNNEGVRLLEKRHFTYSMGLAIAATVTSPMAERTDYHKKVIGIGVGAIVVNHAGAMWAFIPERVFEDNCKLHVFKSVFYSTGMVPLYAIASVLLPQKFAPYLDAMVSFTSVVITLYNFRGILKSGLKWVCEKAVNGARWTRSWIRSTFTRAAQVLPMTNAAPPSSST